MKQLVSGTLLVLFSALIFGYAGASLTHKVLHLYQNSLHHHHHGHSHNHSDEDTGNQHDVDDHSKALKNLNQKEQDNTKQSADFISFFAVDIIHEYILDEPSEEKAEKATSFYVNLYKARDLSTSTPPPSL
ncbi:hypothetical protein [Roseivirga spongicola]|uniref:hypothetical protein n=1 Tax=Roseivirga spongicola TaxID=333140 RepID=UPI002AC962D8|nr:hypothetical protein [Roseivirga spongicola]WPZ12159.1 hypothetical protein T7867_08550 [Roseivirga spongicola]